MHLMLCPNQDRTRLLKEQTKSLEEWLHKDDKTEPELAYWIPKYIQMRGTTQFAGGHVSHGATHSGEPKQDWVEAIHGRLHIQEFNRRQTFFCKCPTTDSTEQTGRNN
jgi:hypothetical protein